MKKKRILRILNRFNVGGPVYNAVYLTKYLRKDLYETLLIGGKPEFHEESAKYILDNEKVNFVEIKYMRRSISPVYDFIALIKIVWIIYNFRPDIIHTHAAKAGLIGRIASLFYFKEVKIIHTYHGNVFEGYFRSTMNQLILSMERFLASKSDKIIAISRSQKHDLVNKFFICSEDKVEIIPLGFDLKRFSFDQEEKRKNKRKELNVSKDQVLISIIGRIVPIKNHKFFIDVIKYCKSKTKISIKALVIGDGPEIDNLIKHCAEIDLQYSYKEINNDYDIFFSSWKKDIDCFLAASDVIALTSNNEGTPVSIIESMASGTAAISTNVGGVSDIIENYKNGIVSKNTVKGFGSDLIELINNKDLRTKLGINAKNRSLKLFNYDILVNNIEKFYKSI